LININTINSGIKNCIEYIKQNSGKVIAISCSTHLLKTKIELILSEHDIFCKNADKFSDLRAAKNGVFLVNLKFSESFCVDNIVFIPDEVFIGKKLASHDFSVKKTRVNTKKLNSIEIGCFVVHKQYGIGKFDGTELITTGGITHECVKIIYAENSALYVPIENMNQISVYEVSKDSEVVVNLDSLKSNRWQGRKKRTESKIQEMAFEILKIAAERKASVGEVYNPVLRSEMLKRIEHSFHYVETEDQLKAIESVYDDLSNGRIMNRLVCGDVGFGKTEIAIRAAFMVLCGKACGQNYSQVAMLCPAVFLAGQHFENISKRFEEFGLRVELLSRFVDNKKAAQIKQDLKDGKVDMIIGTHALLQDTITFKNLGLIICDEEQLFGVAHKEKLKTMAKTAHLLTITATPIPRTLQTALYGITDISMLTTPPFGRSIIKTDIITFEKERVHDILLAEKQHGGQSIIITPKIADIDSIIAKIQRILPGLSIGTMHGNHSEKDLDLIIHNFYSGKYDIIIATTIIATGMDFGNSNTIIINRPEMFGLSQLYQIRGRVGRRDKQAYCYLMADDRVMADRDKMRRLSMLQAFNYSGSSIAIASADLDLRGGGNLLGKDQSGVISEVGPELYYELLEQAMQESNGNKNNNFEITVDIGKSIYIPAEYIIDAGTRIEFYRKIAAVETHDDVLNLKSEMIDRFGTLPDSIENLFETVDIKQICRTFGICAVKATKTKIRIKFIATNNIDIDKILDLVKAGKIKLNTDNSIEIIGNFDDKNIKIAKIISDMVNNF